MADIAKLRLFNQQINQSKFTNPKDLVGWMGAMQAQDDGMVKWAVGLRLPEATEQTIEEAINRGEIIRTHLLRPTWHLAAAEDIAWLLALTAPRIKSAMKSRHIQLGLTDSVISKSNAVIEKALRDGMHWTREALARELEANALDTQDNRMSHFLLRAELDGIICSGAIQDGKQTYALFAERIPRTKISNREEGLAALAKTYFSSHGPATLRDFAWWSGLSVGDATHALQLVKSCFTSEILESKTYWFSNEFVSSRSDAQEVFLLPAFDEWIISYQDRSAALSLRNQDKVISKNGVFWPVIVSRGQVIGTWKRAVRKEWVVVEPAFFDPPDQATLSQVEAAAARFGAFLGKKTELTRPKPSL